MWHFEAVRVLEAKSSTEVTICKAQTFWYGLAKTHPRKVLGGLTESLISSPFAIAKGLVKYERPNS
jgi:hypothetical protein